MTSITLLWVLSILGAVLFAAGGWLLARTRGPASQPLPAEQHHDAEASLANELEQARAGAEALKRNMSAEAQQRGLAEAQVQQVQAQLAAAQGALTEETERHKAAEARAEADLQQLHGQQQSLKELQASLDQAREAEQNLVLQVEGLRGDAGSTEARTAQAEQRAAEAEARAAKAEAEREAAAGLEQLEPELNKAQADLKRAQARLVSQNLKFKELQDKLEKRKLQDKAREEDLNNLHKRLREQTGRVEGEEQKQVGLKSQVSDLRARLAAADGKVSRTEGLEEDLFKLRQEANDLREQAKELKQLDAMEGERQDLAMELRTLKQRDEERKELVKEKMEVTQQLSDARQSLESLEERMEGLLSVDEERDDLRVRVTLQQERLVKLETIRAEQSTLLAEAEESNALREELGNLKQENASLRSLNLVSEVPQDLKVSSNSEGMGGSLNTLLERLLGREQLRSAAFADLTGLPMAGVGEHTESLAAVAATFMDSIVRLQGEVLPLSKVRRLTISDENRLTLGVQPMEASGEPLLLATLTAGEAFDQDELASLLQQEPTEASDE